MKFAKTRSERLSSHRYSHSKFSEDASVGLRQVTPTRASSWFDLVYSVALCKRAYRYVTLSRMTRDRFTADDYAAFRVTVNRTEVFDTSCDWRPPPLDPQCGMLRIVKGSPVLETSVGLRSWSRSSAVSLQVTEAINPAVGCHYFPPGSRLSPQPSSITAYWPVPHYTAWCQRHMCVNNLPRVALGSAAAGIRTRDLLIESPAP